MIDLKQDGTITKEQFAFRMRRLINNEDFKVLQLRWLDQRVKILNEGKKRPSEALWSELKGFDLAVMEPERWLKHIEQSDEDEGGD